MKSFEVNSYAIDSKNWTINCNSKPIGCIESAERIRNISKKTFGFSDWIYFFAVDLLSPAFQVFKERQFSVISGHCKKIVEAQNKCLKLQKKIDQFVQKYFQVVATNVNHINDADVICLGEVHGEFSDMYLNAQLIDTLCEPVDLLLVEHDEKFSFRSDQGKYLRSSIPIRGWDKFDPETIEELSSAFQLDPIDLIELLFFGKLPSEREEEWNWANQKILDDLPERNEHMCKTIETHSKPGRRIYVMAGKGHLSSIEKMVAGRFDFTPQKRAVQQTLAYLKTKKFAILIPKAETVKYIRYNRLAALTE